MKRAIVSVTNDLSTDQRVHRVCLTLHELGYEVLLVGRKHKLSIKLNEREYPTHRMNLLFDKGPFFYIEFNIRLFLFLLIEKSNILVSNDLDTLLPNFLISKIKRKILVYDSHEYFTGVPELVNRPKIQRIWKTIEKFIFPKLKYIFTVNDSIANLYKIEYKKDLIVVRNIPTLKKQLSISTKKELNLPEDKKIILLQGAGINIQRGSEEAVMAMQYIENAIFLIIGNGDVIDSLKTMVVDLKLEEKVRFIPRQPLEILYQYTVLADIGLTLDKDTNINYKYSLPNKLFDYIQAGVPVLASPLVEVKRIVDNYGIGETIENHDPKHIADKINGIIFDDEKTKRYKANIEKASKELCWENEKNKLIDVYKKLI